MAMKLIVGLGNPGSEYEHTRHNAGFMLADALAHKGGAGRWQKGFSGRSTDFIANGEKIMLLKPETFMNLSGKAVLAAVDFFNLPLDDLLVLVDDVALPCGTIRLRAGGSSGGHNGLANIGQALKSRAAAESRLETLFARLRIGVDAPEPPSVPLDRYVLSRFSPAQVPLLSEALNRGCEAVDCWIRRGIGAAMTAYNGVPD